MLFFKNKKLFKVLAFTELCVKYTLLISRWCVSLRGCDVIDGCTELR